MYELIMGLDAEYDDFNMCQSSRVGIGIGI